MAGPSENRCAREAPDLGDQMPNNDSSERNLIRLSQSGGEIAPPNFDPGSTILLGGAKQLDLRGLTEQQKQSLIILNAEAMVAVNRKAQELVADAGALNHSLGTMAHHTNEVAANGHSVTITHTQDTSLGRTEIIMGTSEAAKKGKLTRTQSGATDHTLLLGGIAVAAIVVFALVVFSMGR
jgi:hypothetical protein